MSDYAVIISARQSSARLPGKALISYCPDGTPNLAQIIARWRSSRRSPTVIVATSTRSDDDPIDDLCSSLSVPCYRGPLDDVIARIDGAIRAFAPSARWVARALGDNPLVDVTLADWRLDILAETGADSIWYGGDHSRITYAGTTDVYSRAAWDIIARESTGEEREHPGLYYWNRIEKFAAVQIPMPPREYLAEIRTELDTPADLEMFRELWKAWEAGRPDYLRGSPPPTLWALDYLAAHPEITGINHTIATKTITTPRYARGSAWICPDCRQRGGSIVQGNLVTRCFRCGRPRKYYAHKPVARPAHIRNEP